MVKRFTERCAESIRGAHRRARLRLFRNASVGSAASHFDSSSTAILIGPGSESGALDTPPELSLHSASIREARTTLQDTSKEIERCFLAIGSAVQELPASSLSLTEHSERLLTLTAGKAASGRTFDETIQLVEEPLEFIDRSQGKLRELIGALEESQQRIYRLISSEEMLNRAVAPLTYIQTLFKVESAALDNNVQQMFLALTDDIEGLHRRVSDTFGEKFAVLRTASETIRRVIHQLRDESRTNQRALQNQRQAIQNGLAQLNADIKENEAWSTRLHQVSRVVDCSVGELVISLQAQDIVSQKLSHIVDTLGEARSGLEKEPAGVESRSYAAIACRLQGAQLESVGGDLEKAHRDIGGAVSDIQRNVSTLEKEHLQADDNSGLTFRIDSLVQSLLKTIAEVRGMSQRTVESAERAYTAIRSIRGSASNLTGVMHQLSAQIHLIALNAQVQAAHNCSGTGLEVLASNTALISDETSEISERVAKGVDQLTAELNRLVESFDQLRGEGASNQTRMETTSRTKEQELQVICLESKKELEAVRTSVRTIGELVTAIAAENKFPAIAGERVGRLSQSFADKGAELEAELKKTGCPVERSNYSKALSTRYSVATELEVHRRFFGEAPPPAATAVTTTVASSEEIWFDGPPADAPGAPSVGGDTVVVSTSATASGTSEAPKKEPSLGDNIELF